MGETSLLRSNTDAANLRCSKSIKIAKLLKAWLHHTAEPGHAAGSHYRASDVGKHDSLPLLPLSQKITSRDREFPVPFPSSSPRKTHLTEYNRKQPERC